MGVLFYWLISSLPLTSYKEGAILLEYKFLVELF
jgi:hypothetical protein